MIKLIREIFFVCVSFLIVSSVSYSQELDDLKIGIVHSELTKQLLYKNDNNFYPIFDWEIFFLNLKISYDVIEDDELENYEFKDVDVLILPSVEILAESSIENIKDYLNEGGNLFILGALGTCSQNKNIRNTNALEFLTGLKTSKLPIGDRIAENHLVYASNFLTQDLDDKIQFLIMNRTVPLFASGIPDNSKILGSYQLDDYGNQDDEDYPGIVSIENKNSRILWFGFQISQVSKDEAAKKQFEEIILNVIRWLAGKPLAWINSFPSFYESATLFSVWIRNFKSIDSKFLSVFEERKIQLNFFIAPMEITHYFDELNKLSSIGDINLLFDEFDHLNADSLQVQLVFNETSKILRGESRQEYFGIQFLNSTGNEPDNQKLKLYFDYALSPEMMLSFLQHKNESSILTNLLPNYINSLVKFNEIEKLNLQQTITDLYTATLHEGGIVNHIYSGSENKNNSDSLGKITSEIL